MDNIKVLLRSRLNLGFNLNYFNLFTVNFVHLKLFFFTLQILDFFYSKINKPNIPNNILDMSIFENGLINLFRSTDFYLKSKVIKGSHKGKIYFLIFGHFFSKCTFFRL